MTQLGLYETPDYRAQSQQHYQQALQGYGAAAAQPPGIPEPEKTVGGGVQSTASGASAGAMIGSYAIGGSSAGWWGAAIGAVVGLGAYLLS